MITGGQSENRVTLLDHVVTVEGRGSSGPYIRIHTQDEGLCIVSG